MNLKYILARTVCGVLALLLCLAAAISPILFLYGTAIPLLVLLILGVAAFFTLRRWLYWDRLTKATPEPTASKKAHWVVFGAPFVLLPVLLGVFAIGFAQLWSVRKIETLNHPVPVTSWNTNGFVLADGRIIRLPGLLSIPLESAAISEVTKRGVEIGTNGRVFGLVRVHHWCGNDRVREHIARVDIANMLMFLQLGEPKLPNDDPFLRFDSFARWGWRVEQFSRFQSWEKYRE